MVTTSHQTQWEFLMRLVKNNRLPQAIIFSGLASLGKKETALAWAKRLVCETTLSQKPCGQCPQCQLVSKQQHPDIFLIEPLTKEIQVDQIRELQRVAGLKPSLTNRQIFIITQAETLNTEAQNCFLKTLEEPRGQALFILITSQPDRLLETVRSRCYILKFYPLEAETVLLGDAKLSSEILAGNLASRFLLAKKILSGENPANNLSQFLNSFIAGLRQNLRQELEAGSAAQKLVSIIKEVEKTRQLVISTNVNPRLALENLMLNL